MTISGSDNSQSIPTKPQVESVKCYSCGFTEDCTPDYISKIRGRYQGRWLCGLCVEAVKDEVFRSHRLISTEEALNRHTSFCDEYRSSKLLDKAEHPMFVMSKILHKSLDSSRAALKPLRTSSSGLLPGVEKIKGSSLVRSESCFSALYH